MNNCELREQLYNYVFYVLYLLFFFFENDEVTTQSFANRGSPYDLFFLIEEFLLFVNGIE